MANSINFIAAESLIDKIRGTIEDSGLENPIANSNNIFELIGRLIEFGFGIAGLIAVAFIVYGGIVYIMAGGQQDKTQQATKIITSAIIGLIIALAAIAILATIRTAISATGNLGVS